MMRFLKTGVFSTALILAVLSCTTTGNTTTNTQQAIVPDTPVFKKDTINIVAVGDVMIGSAYPDKSNLPKDDALKSFKEVDTFLKRYAGIIKAAGFNLMSVANNHVGDFGLKGRERTAAILDSLNIKYAGLQSHPFTIFEKDSIKYAFCAFAPNENTVSINNLDSAKQLVFALKKQADIVIVSFHGGGEGARFEHVPKRKEIFYNENRGNVHAFAHGVIDAGADVVLGHGPHVTRAVEVYKNKFIAYSLGNFCTYGMFSLKGPNGFAPLLQLKINARGDFLDASIISVKQDKVNGLILDDNHTAFNKIRFLTNTDFSGHQLEFTDNSRIGLKK
jgi:hypothetical protein